MRTPRLLLPVAAIIALFPLASPPAWADAPASPTAARQPVDPPDAAAAIMPLDEVRIGMKGYGLTVFHGTRIEPFPVEVVSVISDSTPRRGTVWIRSDEPRLVHSGPVQGMSGSPIFLWEQGEEGVLGEGGRLIGAFAFGYAMVKECLAGVQPIELMRQVGERSTQGEDDRSSRRSSATTSLQMLIRLQSMAMAARAEAIARFRLDAVTQLLKRQTADAAGAQDAALPLPPAPTRTLAGDGRVQRLLLPMSVGSAEVAGIAGPLLEPLGIAPVASPGGNLAGPPPAGIRGEDIRLEPGSVLSIPLAFGDMDLSASGTVTDVLPDGTVLGFGHAMFGQGEITLPMATGYVHFVVPRLTISFKQSGSLQMAGSLTRDEMAAVAGGPGQRYQTAPMTVAIEMPGQPAETYRYELVNHAALTPVLGIIVALESLTAAQDLPIENTLHLKGSMVFSGDRRLTVDTMLADASATAVFMELLPPLATLMNNPHENLELQAMDLSIRVEPVLRAGSIVHGRLETAEVAPGDDVRFSVVVQPHGEARQTYRGQLRIPPGLPEGDYQLAIVDASTYASMSLGSRPHRLSTTSVDDMAEVLQQILSVDRSALYAMLQLPQQGLAVGRTELPQLPSSRRAILATPTNTQATAYAEMVESKVPTDVVVQGHLSFTVSVRERFPQVAQPPGGGPQQRPSQPRRRS